MKAPGNKKVNAAKIKESLFLLAILAYPLALFLVFYVYVNFNSILLSFQKVDSEYRYVWNGLENYKKVFTDWFSSWDSMLWTAFRNSFLRFIIITGLGMPLNMLFSYYVYKKLFGSGLFRIVVMIPTILSAMLMALITQRFIFLLPDILKSMKITENFPNLLQDRNYAFITTTIYSLWVGFSTALIIYPNAMNEIDEEIVESAEIEGANNLQVLWFVILPLIVPTISTFMVTGVAGILGDAGPLYTFYGLEAPKQSTLMGYVIYQYTLKYKTVQYPYIATLGIFCTLIAFPLTLAVKKLMERCDPMEEKGR